MHLFVLSLIMNILYVTVTTKVLNFDSFVGLTSNYTKILFYLSVMRHEHIVFFLLHLFQGSAFTVFQENFHVILNLNKYTFHNKLK